MDRKDINFGVEKIDHKWYFHFEPSTGLVNSMSVHREDSSIEIPKQLAENIHNGIDNMSFYKVIFNNGEYQYINTVQATPEITQESTYNVKNIDFYKITNNNREAQIVFQQKSNLITVSATQSMKTVLQNAFKKNKNTHKFFVCEKNDHSILHQMIEINLLDLVDQDITIPTDLQPNSYSIFCKKVLEYSHV